MNPEMALARTNPKTGQFEMWAAGGLVSFTGLDAAHALAGARPLGARVCMIKFGCGSREDSIEAERRYLRVLVGEFLHEGFWRLAPGHTSVNWFSIVDGAVAEVLAPTICRTCDGRGWIRAGGDTKVSPCDVCERTGRASWSQTRRAEACGVDRKELREWWRFYEEVRRMLVGEELAALDHMARRLQNRERG